MSQAQDKRLWLLTDEEKEILILIDEEAKRLTQDGPIEVLDFIAMDMLQSQVVKNHEELKKGESTYEIKRDLICLAGHCIRLIKKLD